MYIFESIRCIFLYSSCTGFFCYIFSCIESYLNSNSYTNVATMLPRTIVRVVCMCLKILSNALIYGNN
jgi:hypothetical protein